MGEIMSVENPIQARKCARRRWLPPLGNRVSNAFTLIELMVVLGMLGILMGVAFSGIGQARKQARVAKANAEVRELMNAWLAYEAAHDDWPSGFTFGDKLEATSANLKELIGEGNEDVVYLNAPLENGYFRDPRGTPYRFRLLETSDDNAPLESFGASITFPNRNRPTYW